MIGARVGDLVVEASAGRSVSGAPLWLCRCDCGGQALRTTRALRRALAKGHVASCSRCLVARFRAPGITRHHARVAIWRGLWRDHGTLWSDAAIARLTEAVRDSVAAEMGDVAPDVAQPLDVQEPERTECKEVAPNLPGDPGYEYGYEEIGRIFGCDGGTIRRIEWAALRKLREGLQRIAPDLFAELGRRRRAELDIALDRALHPPEPEPIDLRRWWWGVPE
jgi:hypothetical protein